MRTGSRPADPLNGADDQPGEALAAADPPDHVYYAIADASYFIGAVTLVNSLRLTGNEGPIVILDSGLLPAQRSFLARECTVVPIRLEPGQLTVFAKPVVSELESSRTVILIDTDVIVTASLTPIIERAAAGSICGFHDAGEDRFFPEWESLFALEAPLRAATYVNGSFLALSAERWSTFLERWWQVCRDVQENRSKRAFLLRRADAEVDPIGFNEQDTMNALLMSEVPREAVWVVDHDLGPNWNDRDRVEVLDARSLRCSVDGREPYYLHYTGALKPWQSWGWSRSSFDAFVELLPRVLLANDVPLQLQPREVPSWLRDGFRGRATFRVLNTAGSGAYAALGVLPQGISSRITHSVRTWLSTARRKSRRLEP